ncbi:MAG: type IV secretion system DNA-binding domain-containing protein [Candidatus Magasanikbacteria bacterium]|nr:type IV secretion system DNA-binding domain-containing protein [Candidatus Magasanikbacteria bacterium]
MSEEQGGGLEPQAGTIKSNPEINFFGLTNFRNQNRKFGIKIDDRRRHVYVVGKTGMGKTTILENMVLNDIYAGHGVGLVDPHGDFAEKIINYIPANRINDVVYFNPADIDFPIGFNILETVRPEQKHLVASGLMGVFKKIWPDVWSARMEYILNNTILALLDFPGTTLLGINRMLADADYRRRVVNNSKDPVVKAFWTTEFANYAEKFRTEAVAPIQNKIGQFLSASVIRNIVAQVKSRIDIREIMDNKRIFIMNLSKGRIGEDNSRLLGGMLITKIQLAAMERVDIPETERKDFFMYVDEFQNFANESFANILSEARKYRLDLTMAHQYMEQLEEEVLAAVVGNVGTMITFRVGSSDAEILAKEFAPTFIEEDLVNLPKYHVYLKLMIDGVASRPFSALTLPPIGTPTDSTEKVIRVSRERYALPREKIEDKIARWSGMLVTGGDEAGNLEVDEDEAMFGDIPPKVAALASLPVSNSASTNNKSTASLPVAVRSAPAPLPITQKSLNSSLPKPPVATPKPLASFSRPPQFNSAPSVPGGPGQEKKRKRKRNRGGGGMPPGGGTPVLLGNPAAPGVSLRTLTAPAPLVQKPISIDIVSAQKSTTPSPPVDVPAPLDLGFVPEPSKPPRPPQNLPPNTVANVGG